MLIQINQDGKMCTSSMPKMREHAYIEKKVSTHKIRNIN